MTQRPGAPLAARPLHFVFVVDASGSMATRGKMLALNAAVRGALPHLRDIAENNPFVDLRVRALAFSDGARWHVGAPTRVSDLVWTDVLAGGFSDFGAALSELARVLQVPPMEARAFPPVLVLISDGRPTDDYQVGMATLLGTPWGRAAVRVAIAIGKDVDHEVLSEYIADPGRRPLTANDPEHLAYLVRFVSVAASQMASSLADSSGMVLPEPLPPVVDTLSW